MSNSEDTDKWEMAGFVMGGSHRFDVFRYLARSGPAIPSEVAEETNKTQQRVYDAQKGLQDQNLIELKVPESMKKGRLYALTDWGRGVWEFMVDQGIADEGFKRR